VGKSEQIFRTLVCAMLMALGAIVLPFGLLAAGLAVVNPDFTVTRSIGLGLGAVGIIGGGMFLSMAPRIARQSWAPMVFVFLPMTAATSFAGDTGRAVLVKVLVFVVVTAICYPVAARRLARRPGGDS
jgi:hypothetical protein